jgi:hypothetical protein
MLFLLQSKALRNLVVAHHEHLVIGLVSVDNFLKQPDVLVEVVYLASFRYHPCFTMTGCCFKPVTISGFRRRATKDKKLANLEFADFGRSKCYSGKLFSWLGRKGIANSKKTKESGSLRESRIASFFYLCQCGRQSSLRFSVASLPIGFSLTCTQCDLSKCLA